MTKAKVLERIRKLLALSTSSNKNEAAVASSHARRLMEKHGLTEADVDASGDGMMFELSMGASGFSARWKFVLVAAVAQAHHCDVVGLRTAKRRKVRVVGLKEDTELVAKVFKHLLSEIDRLVRAESNEPPSVLLVEILMGVPRNLRAYLDSFRRGAVTAIIEKLRQKERSSIHPESRALAVMRNPFRARNYIKTKFTDTKYFSLDSSSRSEIDDLAFIRGYDSAIMRIAMPGWISEPASRTREGAEK